uniref:(northern house mosquito) hypothetical protein n=1 Tax=Culex pipiens TaxID=7175 RepID=A0A8D8G117_CULPI
MSAFARGRKYVQAEARVSHYVLPPSPGPDIAAEIHTTGLIIFSSIVLRCQFQLSLRIMCLFPHTASTHGRHSLAHGLLCFVMCEHCSPRPRINCVYDDDDGYCDRGAEYAGVSV